MAYKKKTNNYFRVSSQISPRTVRKSWIPCQEIFFYKLIFLRADFVGVYLWADLKVILNSYLLLHWIFGVSSQNIGHTQGELGKASLEYLDRHRVMLAKLRENGEKILENLKYFSFFFLLWADFLCLFVSRREKK